MPKTQLEARVIKSYNAGPVRAFSGREYVRSEWRLVPVGYEDEAQRNALLETRPYRLEKNTEPVKASAPAAAVEETHTPESEFESYQSGERKSKRRSTTPRQEE